MSSAAKGSRLLSPFRKTAKVHSLDCAVVAGSEVETEAEAGSEAEAGVGPGRRRVPSAKTGESETATRRRIATILATRFIASLLKLAYVLFYLRN